MKTNNTMNTATQETPKLRNRSGQAVARETENPTGCRAEDQQPQNVPRGTQPAENKQPRPFIDFALRSQNRNLTKGALLALLRTDAPDLYDQAQIVGTWVWMQFPFKQPPEVTTRLSQLGFHWNNKRKLWQHPCGPVTTEPSPDDPREKYGMLHPADMQPA